MKTNPSIKGKRDIMREMQRVIKRKAFHHTGSLIVW
jgi:hypothetical protein